MSVFKCKMCGGTLDIKENETVATCEYCGTRQTIPRLDRERKIALYDRADHFRRNNEFDKAIAIYEQVLNEDTTDAEGYWSLVLCRYGIEYVKDPATNKRVPTVNRTQFTSIFDDENYKAAIRYADANQKKIYEEEAEAINNIQKGILAISQREEPFDVFICYKETDKNGRRTLDSVLATDLYHQLTKEGLKVFFSRITLEDKLGTAYEPYIFAALNSAKVMVAIGTSAEYFNAAWVKNEWSRYLAIVKQSHGEKVLIPAYRDMDPYDLPEEFAHLQAQDMSKLGFMQDLIRGIKKITGVSTPNTVEIKAASGDTNVAPLLKRVYMFLEDGDFSKADDFCEQVLNKEPENAEAYVGKLLTELKLKKRKELAECNEPFDGSSNYEKAMRFADDELKAELTGYINQINTRNENTRKQEIYDKTKRMMDSARKSGEYTKAAELFSSITDFDDAETQTAICLQKAEEAKKIESKKAKKNKKLVAVLALAACAVVAVVLVVNNVIIPNGKYSDAVKLLEAGKNNEAYEAFTALGDYKDSKNQANLAMYNEAVTLKESGETAKSYGIFDSLGDYKDSVNQARQIRTAILKAAKPGEYVVFGKYEQDNDESNGKEPIEWLVLDSKDNKKLLISKYALDSKRYNDTQPKVLAYETVVEEGYSYEEVLDTDATWENCTLRQFLNDEFYNEAFSVEEKKIIKTTEVSLDKEYESKSGYFKEMGKKTNDNVFLLNASQFEKYIQSNDGGKCKATPYAVANGAHSERNYWWLRNSDGEWALFVQSNGVVNNNGGTYVTNDGAGVRPAIWVGI